VLNNLSGIEQCKDDGYLKALKEQEGEGCHIWGQLTVSVAAVIGDGASRDPLHHGKRLAAQGVGDSSAGDMSPAGSTVWHGAAPCLCSVLAARRACLFY
jgi:hypothetical protein